MITTRSVRRAACAAVLTAPVLAAPLAVPAAAVTPTPPAVRPRPAPPALTVEPSWLFQVGGQVDKAAAARASVHDLSAFHRQVPVRLVWSATSRVGIDHYDLYRDTPLSSGALHPLLLGTHRTSYPTTATDVHGAIGPINQTLNVTFQVVATDRLGQRTVSAGNRRIPVHYEQENGRTFSDGSGASRIFRAPVAGPGWRTVRGADFDGGAVLSTALRGARVALPLTPYHTQRVALEMTTGPRLGAVEVRIDGRKVGVVDTWAPRARARVLVAEYRLTAGRHTVTLVNLGLRYRPTVQLDGVFVSD